ncbi:MAG: TonB-dependent receptor, partial [Bryobacteraceae bacterium]
ADLSPTAFINREATTPYSLNLGVFQSVNPIDAAQPQGRTLKTYDIQDNASYILGRHDIQFGFQAQLIRIASYLQNNSLPTLYLGLDGSGSLADIEGILSGSFYLIAQHFFPVNSSGTFGAVPDNNYLSLNNYAAYVQDTWKVNRRLVLIAGLRYEHYSTLSDDQGLFYTPQIVNGDLAATFSAPNPVYNPQGGGFYPSMNNVGPSIGLAFDPSGSGKTVFRAAYGIGYVNDDFVESLRYTLAANEYYLGNSVNAVSGTLSPGTLENLSSLVAVPSGGSGVSRSGSNVLGLIDPRLRAPYVQQWSAGVQREMRGFLLDMRYVGNHAVRLLREDELYAGNNTAYYMSNSSASTYNALQFDVSRRLRRDVQFQANYTFAKALTDSNTFTSIGAAPYRDPDNHSLDKGPAVFDVRNAFKINLTYDLPFGRGRLSSMPLRGLLGGWSVSAIAVAQSGEPFSIYSGICDPGCQTATTLAGGSVLSQIVSFYMTGNGPSIINTQAPRPVFFASALGSPGGLGLRSFYGPSTFDLDLGIQKQFRITERQSFELRGVAINALNHPSFGFNNQFVNDSCSSATVCVPNPSFGQSAYTVYSPRTVQLSAYYRF